jgi:hypothetical protein
MRRAPLGVSLVLIGLLAACGDDPQSPTQPSPRPNTAPPGPTPPAQLSITSCRLEGPDSIQPGQSAQFTAIARYSDGSSRDVTTEVPWTSADQSVLFVTDTGTAVAREMGDVELRATVSATCTAQRQVLVLPAGRFMLQAIVLDDQVTASVLGVRVEVASGPSAGVAATTDWNGNAKLLGVAQDAEIRFSKDGYEPIVQTVHFDGLRRTIRLQMKPSGVRVDLAGKYELTISSGSCEGGGSIPDAVRTRTYTARMWNAGLRIQAQLSGASFALGQCLMSMERCAAPTGNVFTGQTQARDARFTLVGYTPAWDWNDGIYPDLVESIPGVGLLAISGNAQVSPTADGFSGTLDGAFEIYDNLSVQTTTGQGRVLASCRSNAHRFTLVR